MMVQEKTIRFNERHGSPTAFNYLIHHRNIVIKDTPRTSRQGRTDQILQIFHSMGKI